MKILKLLSLMFAVAVLVTCHAFAAPSLVDVSDYAFEDFLYDDACFLLSSDGVEIGIGEKMSASNVRYYEINGVQTKISDNADNTFFVSVGDDNLLIEVVEKTSEAVTETVKTQYFYFDAEGGTVSRVDLDSFMNSYSTTSIRTGENSGIRFKSRVANTAKVESEKFEIEEYGYIVAVTDNLAGKELTLDSDKYVKGVGYNKKDGVDIVYDSSNDEYTVFTGVLKNIPVNQYKTGLTCKTYTKIRIGSDVFTVYGEPIVGNVFDVAKNHFTLDYTETTVARIIFDYIYYKTSPSASFTDVTFSKNASKIRGRFTNTDSVGEQYYAYLVAYDNYGGVVAVERSDAFPVKSGANSFTHTFTGDYSELQTKVYVLTSDLELICQDSGNLSFFMKWQPEETGFYKTLSDSKYGYGTTFDGCFEEDEEISVVEGMTIASNLHAKYNNVAITDKDFSDFNHTLEMDDESVLVDLNDRNSVNLNGINFTYAEGGIDEENSYLYATSVVKESGGYDPQVIINGLKLDSRNYNKVTIRMKYERVSGGTYSFLNQTFQMFYKTSVDSAFSEAKSARVIVKDATRNPTSWFDIVIDFSSDENWKEVITSIRIDPLNGKSKFYIDSVKFSKSENSADPELYDKYLDYAYDNKLVNFGKFTTAQLSSNITRKDFLDMIIRTYPEAYFSSINNISGIPDVDKNIKNSEVYYTLYSSGITLGFDDEGNLGLDKTITRSEASAIINRLLVPSNRLRGTVDSDWGDQGSEHDFEFNTPEDKDLFKFTRAEILSNEGGTLKVKTSRDAYMIYNKPCTIDSEQYSKLRIRMKAEFDGESDSRSFEFFFLPEGVNNYSGTYCITTSIADYYLDEFGWYIFEIDLSTHPSWKGTIKGIRFDMINDPGTYTYDYIRFIENPYYGLPSDHDDLIDAGYSATKLMPEGFEDGFVVSRVDQSVKWPEIHGLFNEYCYDLNPSYDPDVNKPLWTIGPWWQGTGEGFSEIDLIENRDTTKGKYVLADTYGVNTITYDPVEKSITQRLNATKIYNGKPHDIDTYKWWPHQLLDTNANFTTTVDKETHSAGADRMFVELDIRMLDFKNTTNPEGRNVCSYLAYFYLRPKATPTDKIWFGLTLFNTSATVENPIGLSAPTNVKPNWSPDSAAHQFMYGMPMAVVYGGIENSFNPSKGVVDTGEEWKHIRLDITPHIDKAVEWANRDNIFGREVTKEEMFFDGVNIGYEIHGNYDCTIEFKNFNMISYNLD